MSTNSPPATSSVRNSIDIEADDSMKTTDAVLHKITLREVLSSPDLFEEFREFLAQEFCVENLMVGMPLSSNVVQFWKAVERFKEETPEEQIVEVAKTICTKFIGEKSKTPINIEGTVSSTILTQLSTNSVSKDLFDKAQNQIYTLMKLDSFARFQAFRQ
jgi:hypothetical protein